MTSAVLLAVEQLRREVPGGVGRYATGLLQGLLAVPAPPIALLASRHVGSGPDPLERWGFEVRRSRIPSPFLTAAWDHGLAPAPRGAGVVHSVSLAAPPVRPPRRRGGRPLVVTVHDLAWRTHPEATTARGRRWHEAALGRALVHADGFVVPSAPVATALVAAGADPATVRVIPHGADHLPPPDDDGATSLLRRLGVAGDYLLAAGTLEPRKNLDRLAEAYTAARPSLPGPWPLLVVGPSGWGEVRSRGTEGVVFAGRVDDAVLSSLYAGARAFAYVPLEEGFGFPPVEAMASGVPVVVSSAVPSVPVPSVPVPSVPVPSLPATDLPVPDIPAPDLPVPDIPVPDVPLPGLPVPPDVAPPALVVDPWSVDDIAAALVRIACDDALRAQLAQRGAELVAPLTWAAAARAHIGWWEELR